MENFVSFDKITAITKVAIHKAYLWKTLQRATREDFPLETKEQLVMICSDNTDGMLLIWLDAVESMEVEDEALTRTLGELQNLQSVLQKELRIKLGLMK